MAPTNIGLPVALSVATTVGTSISGGAEAPQAAPLPTMSSANAMQLGNGGTTRYNLSNVALPAGDWCFGFLLNVPTSASLGQSGSIFSGSSANNYVSNNCFHIYYNKANCQLSVSARDANMTPNTLGVDQFPKPNANTTPVGIIATHAITPGTDCWVFIQKTGNLAQIWLAFNGHAPVKSGECYTSIGAVTCSAYFGLGHDSSDPFKGIVRNLFKVSYALSKAQMQQITNGTDPTTLGSYAADDYLFTLAATGATLTSTINSITMTRTFASNTITTGIGYAAMTNPVYLDPLGSDGFVVQQVNGTATVPLSGTYLGSDGDIQAQFIDQTNTAFSGWQTIQAGATGGTWSGSAVLPKGQRWIKVQLRKVIAGVPSTDVMTTALNWGIGEDIILSGQSLMQHMGFTALPFGSNSLYTPNGFISEQLDVAPIVTTVGAKHMAIQSVSNQGGLIKVTFAGPHGQRTGKRVVHTGIGGTVEANGLCTITVLDRTSYTIDGSTFVNAYTSGGFMYLYNTSCKVLNRTYGDAVADAHVAIANYISAATGSVVCISNQAVGGQAINQFFNYTQTGGQNCYGATAVLASYGMGKVGNFLWLHGHQNIGQTGYFSSGGSPGAWTGWGDLGTLYDFNVANLSQSNLKFGLAAFTSVGGISFSTPSAIQEFRHGMQNWVVRKRAGGSNNCFFLGWYNDMQPQWENGTTQNAHLSPTLKGYMSQAARLGHATATYLNNGSDVPYCEMTSATRSGAVITVNVAHNGGSSLKVLKAGAMPSGFEASTASDFSTLLTINSITLGSNTITLTLASDPGAAVYIRYQFGRVGTAASGTYGTIRVTNVADNGSNLARVSAATTGLTPSGSQKPVPFPAGSTGKWYGLEGVKMSGTGINDIYQITRIDDNTADLIGSDFSTMGTFTAGQNAWQGSATGVVAEELGIPIYDNRTIGGVDTNGAPLAPIYTYLLAA